jgi:hypothetical protein
MLVPSITDVRTHALQPASTNSGPTERIDLGERLATKTLRPVNRQVTSGDKAGAGVHVNAAPGIGIAWIEGTVSSVG